MLRPLHFILFSLVIAFVVATPVPGDVGAVHAPVESHVELGADASDLEADASGWGYAQPWYGRSGWNGRGAGWYGKGAGWNARGWNGGGGWYGKNYGWNGRGAGWW